MMRRSEIRFGVGFTEGPQAGYWKVRASATRPEVFVTLSVAPHFHVSLHEALEHWHVKIKQSADAPSQRLMTFAPVRLGASALRAAELATLVECVGDPSVVVTSREVVWIRPPDTSAVMFDLVIEAPGVDDLTWPGMTSMGTQLVGRVELVTGHTASVVWRPFDDAIEVQVSARHAHELARRALEGQSTGLLVASEPDGVVQVRQLPTLRERNLRCASNEADDGGAEVDSGHLDT